MSILSNFSRTRIARRGTTSSTVNAPDNWTDANVSDPGTTYALRRQELMALERALRELGADTFLDVPRLTVIGGQSAGKSSLVEAVSGINVPRDSNICTRCPVELSIQSDGATQWSCSISLRWKYDPNGNERSSQETQEFGPQLTQSMKANVEIWLRRAQAAILNPHRAPEEFYTMTAGQIRKLSAGTDPNMLHFSKNAISVKLMDPEATDLSFVDLPGLIQNADLQLVTLIHDLVVERIQGQNNLILVTIPMPDDMENQLAVRLAKEVDSDGQRTIGVLTKPDMLTPGASGTRNHWKQVLLGKEHALKLGYYCVRLPDDDERASGRSRAASQRRAAEFFDKTAPWNEIPSRNRFGIPGFVGDISKLLVEMLLAALPKMREAVDMLLEENIKALEQLPVRHTRDSKAEAVLRVSGFCTDVQQAVMGDTFKKLVQTNRQHYNHFKHQIQATCPDFRPFHDHTAHADPDLRESDSAAGNPFAHVPHRPVTHQGEVMDFSFVKKAIADSVAFELPGHVPFGAALGLILAFTKHWTAPSRECFDAVFETLTEFLKKLTLDQFGQFQNLHKMISEITSAELEKCKAEALEFMSKILQLETIPVYTQNYRYLEQEKIHWLTRYHPGNHYVTHPSSPAVRVTSSIIPVRELSSSYPDELLVMATVRAYFQVSYKRIIDYIPLSIEHQLQQPLAERLRESLVERILACSGERIEELMSEDPAVAQERSFLEERVARLREIREKLYAFDAT